MIIIATSVAVIVETMTLKAILIQSIFYIINMGIKKDAKVSSYYGYRFLVKTPIQMLMVLTLVLGRDVVQHKVEAQV